MIKGILFDYGGTIDTNGIHWAEVIWEHYQKYALPVSKNLFLEAYRYGERALAINPVVKPFHHFYDVMTLKIGYQFQWLSERGADLKDFDPTAIAEDCTYFAEYTVQRSTPVLQKLAELYPMAIVSNFYGNISTILNDFSIREFFSSVVESAVVNVRKPDPAIYRIGAESIGLSPGECVVIGDSFTKDIVPAKQIGSHAIWLKGVGFSGIEESVHTGFEADTIISDLEETPVAVSQLAEREAAIG